MISVNWALPSPKPPSVTVPPVVSMLSTSAVMVRRSSVPS
jgi:hypothetical protein